MGIVSKGSNSLSVLIVGCGNIAGGFDLGRPPGYFPYTHAGAYAGDDRFHVAACVEPDDVRRNEFMTAWQVPLGFRSFDELLDTDESFDVISICSPTNCHAKDIETALGLQPSLIFCEKPLTPSLFETERLVAECDKANIPLAVNHTYRWDPDILKLKAEMSAGKWGQLRSILGLYNKGILNNGSHMMDILHLLVGHMKIVKVGNPVDDYFPGDPTVPVWLEGPQGVPVQIACAHAEDYAIFELELVFSLGILTMEDGGLSWYERRAIESDAFKGYRKLEQGVRRPGKNPQAMLQVVDNIYRAIKQDTPLASNGTTGLAAQQICEEIRQQACAL